MNAQTDGAASWTGGGNNANWSNPDNWTTASYPSGDASVVLIGDANQGGATYPNDGIINLDVDVSLKQLKMGGGVPAAFNAKITGTNTMTLTGGVQGSAVTNVIQINKANGVFTFDCNVTIDSPIGNATRNAQLNSTGAVGIVFSANKTLTINDHFGIIFKAGNNHQNYATFSGNIASGTANGSTLTKDLIMKDYGNATFSSTVNMDNFAGDLQTAGGNTSVGTKIDGPVKVRFLQLANAHNVTINKTGSITASGNTVTTANNAKIIIKSEKDNSGSLIAKNAAGNTSGGADIKIRFEKVIDRLNANNATEWSLLGIPVEGETSTDVDDYLLINNNKKGIGYFDNATGAFVTWAENADQALTPGKGYHATPDANGTNEVVIEGIMKEEGFFQTTVTDQAGDYGNWNLIGNPYTSYLYLNDNDANADAADSQDDFLSDNAGQIHNTYEAIYAWNGESYVSYNSANDSGRNYIAPGEGFFIYIADKGDTNDYNINFREKMMVADKGANFNANVARGGDISSSREAKFRMKVEDTQENRRDYANLYFTDEASKGLDSGYDLGKFPFGDGPKISSRLVEEDEGHPLEKQHLPYSELNNLIVPLVLSTNSSSLKLSVEQNSIDNLINVFLEDKLNNTIVEFDKPIDLDFSNDENPVGRFFLHFTDELIPELPTDKDLRIFKVSDNEIKIMGDPTKKYSAEIYDFSGRLINHVNFKHKINVSDLKKGIKILKIKSDDNVNVIKKFKLN